jgi:predicted Fe-Mo cluster-binding NifX family protein
MTGWRKRQVLDMANEAEFTQGLIDGLDKTTKTGFAEALLIAISDLKNKDGLRVRLILGDTFEEHIEYLKQIAEMMVKEQA